MGLQLEMMDGEKLLIGTRKPEELAAWVENWRQTDEDGEFSDKMVALSIRSKSNGFNCPDKPRRHIGRVMA